MAPIGDSTGTPKLRFPEYRGGSAWTTIKLGERATLVTTRVGSAACTPYTVTAGTGLVSQHEKLGRTIAGNSLTNYISLRRNDFAYNKSSTKAFPQGYIARYVGEDDAAVPSSIFTCFRVDELAIDSGYLDYLFASNLHGRWLRNYLTVGARAHGSLNVSNHDLLALPIPVPEGPTSVDEQQQIAACLTSLDEVVSAQGRKLEALKEYKRGLMQQLFPREGETVPRLRFPEFRDGPELSVKAFDELYEFKPTNSLARDQLNYSVGKVKNVHYGDIHTRFASQFRVISEPVPFVNPEEQLTKIGPDAYCQVGDMIFADASEDLKDVGKSIEVVDLNGEKVLAGSHTILARQRRNDLAFGFGAHLFKSRGIRAQIEREAQGTKVMAISPGRLAKIRVAFPASKVEQQRIAHCLDALDTHIAGTLKSIEFLRVHKVGLMQQLFPAYGAV